MYERNNMDKGQRIKLVNAGNAWDGKEGTIEYIDEDVATVFVDFDDKGHKVRQDFKLDMLQELGDDESVTEDVDDDDDISDIDFQSPDYSGVDDRIIALADYLEVDPEAITEDPHMKHVYEVSEEVDSYHAAESYYVLTYDEARAAAEEYLRDMLYDSGPAEFNGYEDYLNEEAFNEMYEDNCRERVDYMDDDEVIDEAIDEGVINFPDDFTLKPDVDTEDEDFDDSDRDNYDCNISMDSLRDKLIDHYYSIYSNGIEWFMDMYGERDLRYEVNNNPDLFDADAYIEDELRVSSFGGYVGGYDDNEISLDGGYYAYRYN